MSDWAMLRTCSECPWLKSSPRGQFSPERYAALRNTCRSGGLWPFFACHKTPEGKERACAGFLLVQGADSNRVRLCMGPDWNLGMVTASGPLYGSFRKMALANGYRVPADDDDQVFLRALREGSRGGPA